MIKYSKSRPTDQAGKKKYKTHKRVLRCVYVFSICGFNQSSCFLLPSICDLKIPRVWLCSNLRTEWLSVCTVCISKSVSVCVCLGVLMTTLLLFMFTSVYSSVNGLLCMCIFASQASTPLQSRLPPLHIMCFVNDIPVWWQSAGLLLANQHLSSLRPDLRSTLYCRRMLPDHHTPKNPLIYI